MTRSLWKHCSCCIWITPCYKRWPVASIKYSVLKPFNPRFILRKWMGFEWEKIWEQAAVVKKIFLMHWAADTQSSGRLHHMFFLRCLGMLQSHPGGRIHGAQPHDWLKKRHSWPYVPPSDCRFSLKPSLSTGGDPESCFSLTLKLLFAVLVGITCFRGFSLCVLVAGRLEMVQNYWLF